MDPQHVHMKSVRRTVQIPLDSPARKQFPLHFLMHSLVLLGLRPKQLRLVRYSGWYARSRPRPILIPLSNPGAICFIGIWHRKWGIVGTERSFCQTGNCSPQKDPIFKAHGSSKYANISCSDPICSSFMPGVGKPVDINLKLWNNE